MEKAARCTLARAGPSDPADMTVVLTGDEQLHELNLQYLGIDAPTDVLSFPAGDTDPDTGSLYLGDVVISFPRASVQAHAAKKPVETELQLLVVHGVLHLLGYDHEQPDERKRMQAKEKEILKKLGFTRGRE